MIEAYIEYMHAWSMYEHIVLAWFETSIVSALRRSSDSPFSIAGKRIMIYNVFG